MYEFELLETDANTEVAKLLNQKAQEGWKLVSLHVTEKSNGFPRYTMLMRKPE